LLLDQADLRQCPTSGVERIVPLPRVETNRKEKGKKKKGAKKKKQKKWNEESRVKKGNLCVKIETYLPGEHTVAVSYLLHSL
jgi:hypothetical protein